jgi:hypothetical protein
VSVGYIVVVCPYDFGVGASRSEDNIEGAFEDQGGDEGEDEGAE